MKTYKNFNVAAIIIFTAMFTIGACKKKDTTEPPIATGTVLFHLHTDIDTNEVDEGVIAKDADGRYFKLDVAKMFISGIKLKKNDGTWQSVDNVYLLKTITEEEYVVGTVPTGNYLAPSFSIGVDASANITTPSSHSSGPLADTSMWFGATTQGYIFVNLQGMADTMAVDSVTLTDSSHVNVPFSYKLGTSAQLKTGITLPDATVQVTTSVPGLFHMNIDYGKLLHGIDFKTQPTATPWINASVTTQIANNVSGIFSYE